ncbi:MAG: hypothetical protein KDB53_08970 [Planctomycetes bacterium]|nr:hypothetical protein [Planctomycetota bacterium]
MPAPFTKINRSPVVSRMLGMEWRAVDWPTVSADGYGDAQVPLTGLARVGDQSRPFVILVEDATDQPTEPGDPLIRSMFGIEEAIVASKVFNCFRFDISEIPDETLLDDIGKKLPAVLVYTSKGSLVGKVTGDNSKNAKRLLPKIKKAFDDHFDARFTKWVDQYLDQLVEIEKAEDDVANAEKFVKSLNERIERKGEPTAKLAKDLAEREAKVEEAKKAFEAAKATLATMLEVPSKEAKNANTASATR